MESHCLSFREIPHTTKLFLTFLEDFSRVQRYFAHPPTEAGVAAAAREIKLDAQVRSGVVKVLREQNLAFGADSATMHNLDRLAQGAINELMARNAAQPGELARDDPRREVPVVFRFDVNVRIRKSRADEISHLLGSHAVPSYRTARGSWILPTGRL